MTRDRLEELLTGPLAHPLPRVRIRRLVIALCALVQATGDAGDAALEAHCATRHERDRIAASGCLDE